MRLWTGSVTALALSGLLVGCNKAPGNAAAADNSATAAALPALPQALPMQAGAAGATATAPSARALPASAPVRVAALASSGDAYAYLDRAAGQSDAYGDAPPDYAFDYDGVSPWAWQAGDGSTEYAEPVDGGYRSYYYEPGQDQPYLVRDGDYSYAYAGAALVAIYLGGRLMRHDEWGDRARYAAGYRDRAENLYRASHTDRRGVVAADWAARRQQVARQRGAWAADRARQPDWAAYHREHAAQERDHWAQDSRQRAVAARQFEDWHQQGYRGSPPYARPAAVRPVENRSPPETPDAASRASDRRDDRPPFGDRGPEAAPPVPDRRAPPERAERPAPARAAPPRPVAARTPEQPVASPERVRSPMLGSDTRRMREHDIRPLDGPRHEAQRAEARTDISAGPARIARDPVERAPVTPRPAPHGEAPRAAPQRPQPHVETPRPMPERAPPRIEAPHEAPHVAPPHASEQHRGERPH